MTEISYKRFGLDRTELLKKIQQAMSEKRFQHVLGVEQTCIELAERFDGDVEKSGLAGLTHDYAKERPDSDFIKIIGQKNLDPQLLNWGNAIWHGVVGAYIVEDELGITDAEILEAIQLHTSGKAQMSKLAKILYVGDYIEAGRNFPGVHEAREAAKKSLDDGVAFEALHVLTYLTQQRKKIYPLSLETYNNYVGQ